MFANLTSPFVTSANYAYTIAITSTKYGTHSWGALLLAMGLAAVVAARGDDQRRGCQSVAVPVVWVPA